MKKNKEIIPKDERPFRVVKEDCYYFWRCTNCNSKCQPDGEKVVCPKCGILKK